jgi:hypothetical protein
MAESAASGAPQPTAVPTGHILLAGYPAYRLILFVYSLYALFAFAILSEHQGPVEGYDDWAYYLRARTVQRWLRSEPGERPSFYKMATEARIHSPLHVAIYSLLLLGPRHDTSPFQQTSHRVIQLFQLLVSIFALWLTYRFTFSLFGPGPALVALVCGVAYFPIIATSLMLLAHALSAVFLLLLLMAVRGLRRAPELQIIFASAGSVALAYLRYSYLYLPPLLLACLFVFGAAGALRRKAQPFRPVTLVVCTALCAVFVYRSTTFHKQYLASADSVAYGKGVSYRAASILLDSRADGCRWEAPTDQQTVTWEEHLRLEHAPVLRRAGALAVTLSSRLTRLIQGNLNLRRAHLWPFTPAVQRVIGTSLALLLPLFLLSSARVRSYELVLGLVGSYLVSLELASVLETRRLYDMVFISLPMLGAGLFTVTSSAARPRGIWGRGALVLTVGLCLLCFTGLGRSLVPAHIGVHNVLIVAALASIFAAWRILLPDGVPHRAHARDGGRAPQAFAAARPAELTEPEGFSVTPWLRWPCVAALLVVICVGLLSSRVKALQWVRLAPRQQIALEILPAPERMSAPPGTRPDKVSVLVDVFAEGHGASDPTSEHRVEIAINGHPLDQLLPPRNTLFHRQYDGRNECAAAGLLPVLERHNRWHGLSWAAHRHWQTYRGVPTTWLAAGGETPSVQGAREPILVTLRNAGKRPLRILRCLGDFSAPTEAYLPSIVAADGTQFRRGSAYEGSRLDDWRIPYKYRIHSSLRGQRLLLGEGTSPVELDPGRFRYGVFVVVVTEDGRRFIL